MRCCLIFSKVPSEITGSASSTSLIRPAEAEALVAGEAQVEDVRLSLLRTGEQEVLCHQVTALSEGERYLVFLDAQSGRTVAVQKLIVNESGIQPA